MEEQTKEGGWIKLHRGILDWPWYTDVNTFHLFIYLLLSANHEAKPWKDIIIEKGQLVSGIHELSQKTGLTVQQTRTALEKLKSTNKITIKSTNRYSIITICNYWAYQFYSTQSNKQINKQNGKQTISKIEKNNNKQELLFRQELPKKQEFKPPTLQEIQEYISKNGYAVDAKRFFDYFTAGDWTDSKGQKVRNWKQKIITWQGRNSERPNQSGIGRIADIKGKPETISGQKSEFGRTIET